MALLGAELCLRNWRPDFGDSRLKKPRSSFSTAFRTSHSRSICAATSSIAPVKLFEHENASIEDESPIDGTIGRLVQWYPGHIAKAERDLKSRLQLVDVVVEVRDARIPLSTSHPQVDEWIKGKKKILVLNREDMIPTTDRNAWANYFSKQGLPVIFTDGRRGKGAMKVTRQACTVASSINKKRKEKGLLPRAVRAAVIGYPNVGKSSLINRLLKRRMCDAAPRPGVTRSLKWTTIGEGLDLLDAPGILPMRLDDQSAAVKIAICNDIGEGSYIAAGVAAVLFERLRRTTAGAKGLSERYKLDIEDHSGESFLEELAQLLFRGDTNQSAARLLGDFRKGKFGWLSLESPPPC